MGDRNTEISVKGSFVPDFGPPEHFKDAEETSYGSSGLEVSAAYNLLGHFRRDAFIVLGPRLDLAMKGINATRYRSDVSFPVKDLEGLNERVDHPAYLATETVLGSEGMAVGLFTSRAGITFGVGPETDLGMPVGLRLFMTAGPEVTEDYTVRSVELDRRHRKQDGVTALGLKGGMEMLFMMEATNLRGGHVADLGLVLGLAGLRTYNPIKQESEAALELDVGLMVRF